MNKIRLLNPLNPSKIKKKKLFGFDVETIPKKDNKFLMGSIIGEDFKFVSWNKNKLKDKLLSKFFKNKTIVATNLMFDFCSCFSVDELLDKKKFSYLMHNKSSGFIFIKYIPYNIHFIDTFNFFPVSVKVLGEKIKYPKLKFPKILKEINSINDIAHPDIIKEIEEYNIRDSEITYKWMVWFQYITNQMGANLRYTIASSAMDLFKRKYLKSPICQPKKEFILNMYNAYYGGRTETIYRGLDIKDYNYYDINSAYVSVMRKELPDINTIKFKKRGNMHIIDMYNGISEVSLKVNDMLIPYLPFRNDEKKLLFPIGKFEGWYNHFELKKAVDMGYEILNIKKSIYFTDTEDYLKNIHAEVNKIEVDNNSCLGNKC